MTIRFLAALLILIAIFHYIGLAERLYWAFPWYDIVMHIAGGFWTGLLFFYIFEERFQFYSSRTNPLITFALVLGFAALIGVLWEFYEYLADVFILKKHPLTAQQGSVFDTLLDLFNDLVGAGFAALFRLRYPRFFGEH